MRADQVIIRPIMSEKSTQAKEGDVKSPEISLRCSWLSLPPGKAPAAFLILISPVTDKPVSQAFIMNAYQIKVFNERRHLLPAGKADNRGQTFIRDYDSLF